MNVSLGASSSILLTSPSVSARKPASLSIARIMIATRIDQLRPVSGQRGADSFDGIFDVGLRHGRGERQADGLTPDAHRVRELLWLPAEFLLIEGMLGHAHVMNAHADLLLR